MTGVKLVDTTMMGVEPVDTRMTGVKLVDTTMTGVELVDTTMTGIKLVDTTVTGVELVDTMMKGVKQPVGSTVAVVFNGFRSYAVYCGRRRFSVTAPSLRDDLGSVSGNMSVNVNTVNSVTVHYSNLPTEHNVRTGH
ncbi:hypothetical protein LSAT2_014252 [Lamellibrachia satsuma]|nr:hypothetical protein LSAT2_014252 [Lamellibrachia satsuma]